MRGLTWYNYWGQVKLDLSTNNLSGCVPSSLEDQLNFDASYLSDLPFCWSHAPSAGDGQHIVQEALPARV